MATEFDNEDTHHLKSLLIHTFSKEHLINQEEVFLNRYCGYSFIGIIEDKEEACDPRMLTVKFIE